MALTLKLKASHAVGSIIKTSALKEIYPCRIPLVYDESRDTMLTSVHGNN